MSNIGKVLGVSILGLAVAGCATKIHDLDPKLKRYNTNNDNFISPAEGMLYIEREFDKKPIDGKLSDTEILDALDHIAQMPDCYSRSRLLEALADFRKESLEQKK